MHISNAFCRIAALTAAALLTAVTILGQTAETLVLFDPDVPETPESIVFDRFDNAYISLAMTGEIRRVAPDLTQSTLAFLPIGAPCPPPAVAVMLGLAIDLQDRLYVSVSACDPANQGVWEVDVNDGSTRLLANVPPGTVLNGIDVADGFVYASDTFAGRVWRIPANGAPPEIWADDPLLKIPPGSPFPGPNGLRVFRRHVLVAVSATGNIVSIPILPRGFAGKAQIHATLPAGQGCDEFAIDAAGRIYCTTDPFNTLVRLDPDGTADVLLTEADLLDGPTSAAFGRRGENRKNLYITNAAFPIFTTTFRPSLMRLRVDLPGAP